LSLWSTSVSKFCSVTLSAMCEGPFYLRSRLV
jgi:hypothetical protein